MCISAVYCLKHSKLELPQKFDLIHFAINIFILQTFWVS